LSTANQHLEPGIMLSTPPIYQILENTWWPTDHYQLCEWVHITATFIGIPQLQSSSHTPNLAEVVGDVHYEAAIFSATLPHA